MWKPGQIITWNGVKYRIKENKIFPNDDCHFCDMFHIKNCFCMKDDLRKKPKHCYFERIQPKKHMG